MKNHADAMIFHTRICAVTGPDRTVPIGEITCVISPQAAANAAKEEA